MKRPVLLMTSAGVAAYVAELQAAQNDPLTADRLAVREQVLAAFPTPQPESRQVRRARQRKEHKHQ